MEANALPVIGVSPRNFERGGTVSQHLPAIFRSALAYKHVNNNFPCRQKWENACTLIAPSSACVEPHGRQYVEAGVPANKHYQARSP